MPGAAADVLRHFIQNLACKSQNWAGLPEPNSLTASTADRAAELGKSDGMQKLGTCSLAGGRAPEGHRTKEVVMTI